MSDQAAVTDPSVSLMQRPGEGRCAVPPQGNRLHRSQNCSQRALFAPELPTLAETCPSAQMR
jgi:hypothetical protein